MAKTTKQVYLLPQARTARAMIQDILQMMSRRKGVHQWTAGFAVQISHGGVALLNV
jgi:hypothetical protein